MATEIVAGPDTYIASSTNVASKENDSVDDSNRFGDPIRTFRILMGLVSKLKSDIERATGANNERFPPPLIVLVIQL